MPHHAEHPETLRPEVSATFAQLSERLDNASLAEAVKGLLREALSEIASSAGSGGRLVESAPVAHPLYLESLKVTGFRGIGASTRLPLKAKPGVTLVVGRNGSGKSSFAEAAETAFTGRTARLDKGRGEAWRRDWRNLHVGAEPLIEVGLVLPGDAHGSRVICRWPEGDLASPDVEFRRPGHGRRPLGQAGWGRALRDFTPFLSYADLDKVVNGRPSEQYDSLASLLGLGEVTAVDESLRQELRQLTDEAKAVADELPGLITMLTELGDEPRAALGLATLRTTPATDLDGLAALLSGLPDADDSRLGELRATVALVGPDLAQVGPAVDRLREAAAVLDDVRASDAEAAHGRAELLAAALEHRDRHPDERACPVCGSGTTLDEAWAERAREEVAALRQEAADALRARTELASAADAVRYLATPAPARLPASLAVPWREWEACRLIDDIERLASQVESVALVLADACAAVRKEAARELEALDDKWRACVARLTVWLDRARTVREDAPRARRIRAARKWLGTACAELREERLRPYQDHAQRIWEELRQHSSVDLRSVRLSGGEKSSLRKLVMDVSVDGAEATALGVMSQGELHSLALSLFLPRAAAPESPFGFIVIDDPVQSMDPAKVHGLAKVLDALGRHRQVVVFTHDTRLQRAFTTQDFPVTVLEVDRSEHSKVSVRTVIDPVGQALDDAHALARTPGLPPAVLTHVLPSLCRTVLERAFIEAAAIRLHRAGRTEHEVEREIAQAVSLRDIAALGLFGDRHRGNEVNPELRRRCGSRAGELIRRCQEGAHPTGTSMPDPRRFVGEIKALAAIVREVEEARA